jgi:hypothetical protein
VSFADLPILTIAAIFSTLAAGSAPALRPHALAALACFWLYAARALEHPRLDVAIFAAWPGVAVWLLAKSWGHTRRASVAIVFAIYGAALAFYGARLAWAWPWPIMIPNIAPLTIAAAWWRRPSTWAERAALVLPASCAGDLVTTWAGAPSGARVVLGAVTWAAFAECVRREAQ